MLLPYLVSFSAKVLVYCPVLVCIDWAYNNPEDVLVSHIM